jgi:glutaminyl-peptide cyclotransferase
MQKRIHSWSISLAFAALLTACSSPDQVDDKDGSGFSEANTWQHLEKIVAFGPRPSGSQANEDLRKYITSELETLGLSVTKEPFTDETPIGPIDFENLFVDIPPNTPGADPKAPKVIVGAHFDTKIIENEDGSPNRFVGANDGGSGTAMLLELARVMTREGFRRSAPLRLLFIDGEEAVNFQWAGNDNTYGSRYHAKMLVETKQVDNVGAVVILDMLGDKNLTIYHDTYSRPELTKIFQEAAAARGLGQYMDPRRRMPVKDDHLSFQAVGIPAVDLIDFEYGAATHIWHTNDDTLENCSSVNMARAGTIFLAGYPQVEAWIAKQ